MRRITAFFLVTTLVFNIAVNNVYAEQKQIIVEDNYSDSNTYRIIQVKNSYDKISISGRERHKQAVQSTKEIMRLPITLDVFEVSGGFLLPSEIDGVVPDIPYNYFAPLETSSRYVQTLLYNGWELEYYNATSLCIQVGLVNNQGITCRILIFEDYLKVYCSLM